MTKHNAAAPLERVHVFNPASGPSVEESYWTSGADPWCHMGMLSHLPHPHSPPSVTSSVYIRGLVIVGRIFVIFDVEFCKHCVYCASCAAETSPLKFKIPGGKMLFFAPTKKPTESL